MINNDNNNNDILLVSEERMTIKGPGHLGKWIHNGAIYEDLTVNSTIIIFSCYQNTNRILVWEHPLHYYICKGMQMIVNFR